MNEILIFTTGASFGALVVCFSVCAAIVVSGGRALSTKSNKEEEAPSVSYKEEETEEEKKLKKQIENFLNYNGTDEGQSEIIGGE